MTNDRNLEDTRMPKDEPERIDCESCGEEKEERQDYGGDSYFSCPNPYCPDKHEGIVKNMAIRILELEYSNSIKNYQVKNLLRDLKHAREYARSLEPQEVPEPYDDPYDADIYWQT